RLNLLIKTEPSRSFLKENVEIPGFIIEAVRSVRACSRGSFISGNPYRSPFRALTCFLIHSHIFVYRFNSLGVPVGVLIRLFLTSIGGAERFSDHFKGAFLYPYFIPEIINDRPEQ